MLQDGDASSLVHFRFEFQKIFFFLSDPGHQVSIQFQRRSSLSQLLSTFGKFASEIPTIYYFGGLLIRVRTCNPHLCSMNRIVTLEFEHLPVSCRTLVRSSSLFLSPTETLERREHARYYCIESRPLPELRQDRRRCALIFLVNRLIHVGVHM